MLAYCLRNNVFDASDMVGESIALEASTDGDAGARVVLDAETADAVNVMLHHVAGHLEPADFMYVEHKFVFRDLTDHTGEHPYGHADCVIYRPRTETLYVYDYKHGVGIRVPTVGNLQLRYYGLGAAKEVFRAHGHRVKTVVLIVVQPRAYVSPGKEHEPVGSETISWLELWDWETELIDAVERTKAPDAPYVPGDHCRFCDPLCPALMAAAEGVAHAPGGGLQDPKGFDLETLGRKLHEIETLRMWLGMLEKHADFLAKQKGLMPVGWRLVPTQARRQWGVPPETVVRQLERAFPGVSFMTAPELVSPAEADRRAGKKGEANIAQLVERKSSGMKLVPESDTRPGVTEVAASGFTSVD